MNGNIHFGSRTDALADGPIAASCTNNAAISAGSAGQLIIDNCTVHLGIGWRRISDDEHIQAAARGWARFIENHFALCNVRMCLESRGLQSYLVEAAEGFFLFTEDLRCGRLVSRTVDRALHNLQKSPPVFDGPEIEMKPPCRGTTDLSTDIEMQVD